MTDLIVVPAFSKDMVVSVIVDESTSMGPAKLFTISGYNEYLNALKADYDKNPDGAILLTLTKFSKKISRVGLPNVELVHVNKPLREVAELNESTYTPDGWTPLYDAVGVTIKALEEQLMGTVPSPRVAVVIITDGEENKSQTYTREQVKEMIKQKEAAGWSFTFLGANADAWQAGVSLGLNAASMTQYDIAKTSMAYNTVAAATLRGRHADVYGATATYHLDAEKKNLA